MGKSKKERKSKKKEEEKGERERERKVSFIHQRYYIELCLFAAWIALVWYCHVVCAPIEASMMWPDSKTNAGTLSMIVKERIAKKEETLAHYFSCLCSCCVRVLWCWDEPFLNESFVFRTIQLNLEILLGFDSWAISWGLLNILLGLCLEFLRGFV